MHEIALIELLHALDKLEIGDSEKGQVRDLVHRVGAQHGSRLLIRQQRRDLARDLLDQRQERTAICARLMQAFDLSERQAYRDIEAALNLCQNMPSNGRTMPETVPIEEASVGSNEG